MNKIALIITSMLIVGCAGGLSQADRNMIRQNNDRMERLERENRELRRQNAQQHSDSSEEPQPLIDLGDDEKEENAKPYQPPTKVMGASWVRQQHGEYHCYVDSDPHLSQGDRIVFKNDIHNNFGMQTVSNTRANKWVAIRIGTSPVRMMRSSMGGYYPTNALGPGESCTMELGGLTSFKIMVVLFKNRGSVHRPQLVSTGAVKRIAYVVNPMIDEDPVTFNNSTF